MLSKEEWPTLGELARGLVAPQMPTNVAAALEELRKARGLPQLSLEQRLVLARKARGALASIGGKARMRGMTGEQRSEFARMGALARHKTRKPQ